MLGRLERPLKWVRRRLKKHLVWAHRQLRKLLPRQANKRAHKTQVAVRETIQLRACADRKVGSEVDRVMPAEALRVHNVIARRYKKRLQLRFSVGEEQILPPSNCLREPAWIYLMPPVS
jgi:hypothetical protein